MDSLNQPLCARCGAAMPDRWHFLARFLRLPGSPTIGWCHSCIDQDLLADRAHINRIGIQRTLELIEARGPGRVVREVAA